MSAFHRLAADSDGRWWVFDGAGRKKIVTGVDHVRYTGFYSDVLGYAPYGRNNDSRYPSRSAWERAALKRICDWGFTALGTGCDASLYGREGLLYNVPLSFGHHLCRQKDPDLWIVPENRAPCSYIPNMFHPGFAEYADRRAKELCSSRRNDLNLFGYFLDNELVWWGKDKARPLATGLYDTVAKLPPAHTARKALETFKKRHGEDKIGFLAFAAETYFSVLCAAVRRHDPNHLILGVRFAGFNGAHPVVIKACGRHCDVVSVNSYPRADLDRNVVEAWKGGRYQNIAKLLNWLHSLSKKPVLLTEWSFMALDSGCPCTYATGQRFNTQAERTAASELFVRTVLSAKGVVGYNFFAWMDDPKEGTSRTCPENGNYGLVSINDEPYAQMTEMFKNVHSQVAEIHCQPPPQERKVALLRTMSTAEHFRTQAAKATKGRVGCDILPYRTLILTGCGFEAQAEKGKSAFLSVVRLDEEMFGSYAGMVQLKSPEGRNIWATPQRVCAIDWKMDGRMGVMMVSGRYVEGGFGFELVQRLTFAPGFNGFLAEIVSIENTGILPLSIASVYARLIPRKVMKLEVDGGIPELWKAPNACSWVYPDIGRFSARTWDSAALRIKFWIGKEGHPHGDIVFRVPSGLVLHPGKKWNPQSSMGVEVHLK